MTVTQLKGIFKRQRAKVICPGCNKEIREEDDFSEIEYVKTKRGTQLFIHRACIDKVWK